MRKRKCEMRNSKCGNAEMRKCGNFRLRNRSGNSHCRRSTSQSLCAFPHFPFPQFRISHFAFRISHFPFPIPHSLSSHHMISHIQHVHSRLQKAVDRMSGRTDHGFVLVEGCIQHNWNAGEFIEIRYQLIVPRIDLSSNRL